MNQQVKDFCEQYLVERKNTNSLKWDALKERFGNENLTPMWVADMEFKAPKAVEDALEKRVKHGVYGYTLVPDHYYEACFQWQKDRYNARQEKDWLRFSTGVVASLYRLVNAFTEVGDSVAILEPVYYPFSHAIVDTGRKKVVSNLINVEGEYQIDFDDLEKKFIENNVKLMIQCSPHNPVGRVWRQEELVRLFDLCQKHQVLVVSDEIHQDITRKANPFVAALSLDEKYEENLIVVNAPSKTFNLACLLHSHVIIPSEKNRKIYDRYMKGTGGVEVSLMGMVATEAAYHHGSEWLDGLLGVIDYNDQLLRNILQEKAPEIVISEKEGTYLMWLDLRAYVAPKNTEHFVQDLCGIAVDFGEWFGKGYEGFIRINLATDPKYIEAAAEAIAKHAVAQGNG